MTVKYQTLESAMIKGDRFRVYLRSALCSLYGNLESGLSPQGFITHLGQKLKVLLWSRGVWRPSTLSGLKKKNLFLLKAPTAHWVRGTGDGSKGKRQMWCPAHSISWQFQHGKGSLREGRKPTPIRLHRHAAISVPAELNFLDRVIKAAQKNLLTHTLS